MARKRQGRQLAAVGLAGSLCLAVAGCFHSFPFGNHLTSREAPTPYGPSVMTPVPGSELSSQGPPRDLFSALCPGKTHTLHRPRVIHPGEEIAWSIQTPEVGPGLVTDGHALVGPEGTVVVGPYGSCNLAGLTPQQASAVLKRQVSPYVKNPQVTVRVGETVEATAAKSVPVVTRPDRQGESPRRAPQAGTGREVKLVQPAGPAADNHVTSFRPLNNSTYATEEFREEAPPAPSRPPRWPWSLFRNQQGP